MRATWIGLWWNIGLTLLKGTVTALTGSKALLADTVESASDIVVTSAVLVSLRLARRPQDPEHPYGHGRLEDLASQVIGIVLLIAAASTMWVGLSGVLVPPAHAPGALALVAALITIGVKEGLFRYTVRAGKRSGSPAVVANAWGHRSDAYSSIVTVAGIGGALLGAPILDPIAAMLVSIFIAKMGVDIIRESSHTLMDASPERGLLQDVARISESVPGVEHCHKVRGRRAGPFVLLDLTLDMDPLLTISESHDITFKVRTALREVHPSVTEVMVHVNPHIHPHTHEHTI